jgi:hypothetical protein
VKQTVAPSVAQQRAVAYVHESTEENQHTTSPSCSSHKARRRPRWDGAGVGFGLDREAGKAP